MKYKLLNLLFIFILALFIPAFASDIEVQPTMISRSNAQDRVWVGTFQIVWNEFTDKYVHKPVRFREGTPVTVYELNARTFITDSISEKCYYKFSGDVTKNTVKSIKKAIARKFKETSDVLDGLDLVPSPNNFIVYAMLKKDFEFLKEFDKLGSSSFGKNMTAEYFGISNKSSKNIKDGVKVLYYNSLNDFAVMLSAKGGDEVYLYKNSANKEFKNLYRDMLVKTAKYKGDLTLNKRDELKVPNIKFDVTKSFDELCGKRITGTNISINKALETVQFNMDNKGVQLKSEAVMTFETTALPNIEEPEPRYFYFDDTFVIFLKEKDKDSPYFALRVNDITKFQ